MTRLGLVTILLLCAIDSSAQIVSEINFTGLRKTRQAFLEGIVETKVGDTLDLDQIERDVNLIKDLNLFFEVEAEHKELESGDYSITYRIKEATYLYPIISIGGFQDQLQLELGGNQINFLGKGQSLGAKYLWYDRHSFFIFNTAPRHAGRKTGHEFSLTKYSTVEPLYFQDTTAEFNFDNYNFSAGLFYSLTPYIRFNLGGMLMYETYEQLGTADLGLPGTEFSFFKYQIRAAAQYRKLRYHFERIEGIKSELYAETIQTDGFPEASFFKSTFNFNYYKMIGKRGNLALHQRAGISSNNFSPFAPFVLDGFINVRGIGNRIERGTAELVTNLEYRHTVWRHKYFYLQTVGFADFGTLRAPGVPLEEIITNSEKHLYLGAGLRIHSRIAYNTILRVDFAGNVSDFSKNGIVFGFGQFF